jgi:NADH-quinone oxidoreductase subunit N
MSSAGSSLDLVGGLSWCWPEALVLALIMALLWCDRVVQGPPRRGLSYLALAGFLAAAWLTARDLQALGPGSARVLPVLGGTLLTDGLSCYLRLLILLGAMLAVGLLHLDEPGRRSRGERLALLAIATLGAMVLTRATDLLAVYLAVEVTAIAGYLLVGLDPGRRSAEAAVKLALLGMVASALMALGLALLYGLTGSTSLAALDALVGGADLEPPPLLVEPPPVLTVLVPALLLICGLAARVLTFPMHFWVPDVLQGARTPGATFLATVPVLAALTALLRILAPFSHAEPVETALAGPVGGPAVHPTVVLLQLAAAASMLLGNLAAIHQTSIKRLIAYACIANAGYLLLGVTLSTDPRALSGTALHLVAYLLVTAGLFTVALAVERATGTDDRAAWRGLARRSPVLAWLLVILLLALIGIPPTAGFTGKWQLVVAALDQQVTWVAIWALGNMVLTAVYCTHLLRTVFEDDTARPLGVEGLTWALLLVTVTPLLLLPLVQAPLAAFTMGLTRGGF